MGERGGEALELVGDVGVCWLVCYFGCVCGGERVDVLALCCRGVGVV